MANDFTQLNVGANGDYMDESGITYSSPPTTRKRARVVIGGDGGIDELAKVTNADPTISDYGLVTRPYPPAYPHAGDSVANFGSVTLVSSGVETTVSTYTVPTGYTFYAVGFTASGDINAYFRFYIDGVVVLAGRSTAANLNVQLSFDVVRPTATETQVVKVTVYHFVSGVQSDFDATILGYIVPNP